MPTMIWSLLRNHLPAACMAVVLSLLLGWIALQKHELNTLRQEREQCEREQQALAMSNAALLASLQEQNNAVKAMQQEAAHKQEAAHIAMEDARKQGLALRRTAQAIHATADSGDECAMLKDLLRKYARP